MSKGTDNETFYATVSPVMEYLRLEGNPHQMIIISQDQAGLVEAIKGVPHKDNQGKDGEGTCQK